MKILLINNHSPHLIELISKFKNVKVVDFEKIKKGEENKFDAIVLSGGSSFPIIYYEKKYSKELDIIRKSDKPILGICLGFELINFAFGEKLKLMNKREKGKIKIKQISKDKLFSLLPNEFEVYGSHRWIVPKNRFLKSIAKSKDCIEAVKHPEKNIWGVQFHPEVFVKKSHAERILKNFLKIVKEKNN